MDDHLDLQTYPERLQFVRRKLGLEKQKPLAQAVATEAPVGMDLGNLDLGAGDDNGGEDVSPLAE